MWDFNSELHKIKQTSDYEDYCNTIEQASFATRDKFCSNGEHIHIEDSICIDGIPTLEAEEFFVEFVRNLLNS